MFALFGMCLCGILCGGGVMAKHCRTGTSDWVEKTARVLW